MSKPTPQRIHAKKLKRLRRRKQLFAYKRTGIDNIEGKRSENPARPLAFTTRPR